MSTQPRSTTAWWVGALALCAATALACSPAAPPAAQKTPQPTRITPQVPEGLDTTDGEPGAEPEVATTLDEPGREEGRRDPFVFQPDAVLPMPVDGPDVLDLKDMKLIGIITGTAVPKAMFTDSDGFGHIVTEGERVSDGRVTDIRDNEVVIALWPGNPLNAYETSRQRPAPQRKAQPSTRVIRLTGT